MNDQPGDHELIMLSAGRRILIAAVIVAALWALFVWATSTPGGL